MQQDKCLEGGPLLWTLTLFLHVSQKSDDDDDDDDDDDECEILHPCFTDILENAISIFLQGF